MQVDKKTEEAIRKISEVDVWECQDIVQHDLRDFPSFMVGVAILKEIQSLAERIDFLAERIGQLEAK